MDNREIDNKNKEIQQALEQRRINDALNTLHELLSDTTGTQLKDEEVQVKTAYNLMLQYMSRGVMDPQRETVLQHIIDSIYSIADRGTIALKEQTSPMVFYARRRELNNIQLKDLVDQWQASRHKHALLSSVPADQQNDVAVVQVLRDSEKQETAIFNKIWSTYPTPPDDCQVIAELINNADNPVPARCLFLSALFLGLMTLYDENKLTLIARTYITSDTNDVQLRALIYTVLALYMHNQRTGRSATLKTCVDAMAAHSNFAKDLSTLQFLLARSRNTDNISRRVREDIMPGLMNVSPDLMRKLKDKTKSLDITDLEANPEWQEMLEDSGLAKKMEEFSEMQLAGNDVFVSTFSHLKSFPFFHTLSNWFLPFTASHTVVRDTFGSSDTSLGEMISAALLCNSDKYSFCLSMASIPQEQRTAMFSQAQAQHADIQELKSTELPNNHKVREEITNRHLQDLYRFFKFFSRRREFIQVFEHDMDLTSITLLKEYTSAPASITLVAEFYFKNEFYEDAIKCYNHVLAHSETVDPLIFQKLGFAHQNLGNYREALSHYRKYLLAHDNDKWTIKHVASCYRSMGRHDRAIECFKRLNELQPENVGTILSIGNCLLEMGNINEALQYYYQVDFHANSKHRAWRPIAWCLFLDGNNERALDYYDKIITQDTPTAQDYMNRGHVLLCSNQLGEALNSYRESLKLEGNHKTFSETFLKDEQELVKKGISHNDIALILDLINM